MYISWQGLAALAAALGVPSAASGYFLFRLQKKIEKREKEDAEREKAREALELLDIKATLAAIKLAEATAEAVKKIPSVHCNGEMTEALDYAKGVKHDVRDFLTAQATHAVVN